jgi:isopenicillin-N N-acyltransferase-like protein
MLNALRVSPHSMLRSARIAVADTRRPSRLQIPEARFDALPVHLVLRCMLERSSVRDALDYLQSAGSASTANVVLADPTTAVSIELHPRRTEVILPDKNGLVLHTNHLVQLKDEREMFLWPDSLRRLPRLADLTRSAVAEGLTPSFETYRRILSDRTDGETSICRHEGAEGIETVFSIAIDGQSRRAEVKVGRPDEGGEILVLAFP